MDISLSPPVQQRLRALGVIALYLFGSRAQGRAGPLSDYDFGVLLKDPQPVQRSSFELYEKLYEVLSPLTHPKSLEADVIDIVFLDSPRVPLELKVHIIQHSQTIFDAKPLYRLAVETRLLLQAADFAPLRKAMSAALLARL